MTTLMSLLSYKSFAGVGSAASAAGPLATGGRVGETLRCAKLNCSARRKGWPCASTTTWKLLRMNLAIRGIDANLGPRNADSFRADLHPDLKADFVPVRKDLANPPFNMSDWGGENLRQDARWKFGMPPVNYAC